MAAAGADRSASAGRHGHGRSGERHEEARQLFERILARRNPLGLLSEDMAFEDGEAWGNFPQAYSHVGLIMAAMRLSRPWTEAL